MARTIQPWEDLGRGAACDGCRRLEMAFLRQIMRILDDVLAQAKRERHPISAEAEHTMRVLRARYRRLQAEGAPQEGAQAALPPPPCRGAPPAR
ncbi:MAG: hypothetical protein AMS14_08300 [Planctomycetes bacterium DG_20]|nr:MAG: hypothetical protein AMS14_08300 [Planctomycetes bacterium DG_20]